MNRSRITWLLAAVMCATLIGCSSTDDTVDVVDTSDDETETVAAGSLNPDDFVSGALAEDISIVDCTLSGGTETTCYEIVMVGAPADSAVGPFCPDNIHTTSAGQVGIWFDGGSEVYDLDGDFFVNLPNLYDDANWNVYDVVTGDVNVTDTQAACEGAARPDVNVQYQNHCVECSLDYLGGAVSATVLIPTTPVPTDAPGGISTNVGVSLNGVLLAAPAPVQDILSNYTIAAFDDCGGHVNPNDGYHYHAATGCTESGEQADSHSDLLGYALDGYGIYGQLDSDGNEPTALDECRGETDDTRGYHYHAASPSENMFIGCFHGETEGADAGGPPGRG